MTAPVLLISPHPDDIAWSLGGTVAVLRAAGVGVHVLTLFTRSSYAPTDPAHGDADTVTRLRSTEERGWARERGVLLHRATLSDAGLRGYDDDTEMGPEPETGLVVEVGTHVADIVARLDPGLVLAPLAAGGHVDHVATRRAVAAHVPSAGTAHYEDLPYAATGGGAPPPDSRPVVVDTAPFRAARDAGVRTFGSQDPEQNLPVLNAHVDAVGGERIWCPGRTGADLLRRLTGG